MKLLLRSPIAFLLAALLCSNAPHGASAAPSRALDAATETTIGGVGFLDLKTFLIAPSGLDDPSLTSERMRVISPETLLFNQARGMSVAPPAYPDLPSSSVRAKRHRIDTDMDSMTIELNATPVTLELGLRDAMRRDLEESIRLFGVSGLFNPVPGIGTIGLLGNAVGDIAHRIDALEGFAFDGPRAADMPSGIPEPSSLSLFAFGLLVMAWLRRASRSRRTEPRRAAA